MVGRWVGQGTRLPWVHLGDSTMRASPALASVTGELRDARRGTSPAGTRTRVWKRKKKRTGGWIGEEQASRSLIAAPLVPR